MMCGLRVKTIVEAEDYREWELTMADPGTGEDRQVLPEFFISGNLLAHHR